MKYIDPPNKLLKHVDRIADIARGGCVPVNVEIDLTNRCNLGCVGCHMAYTHSRGLHSISRVVDTGDVMSKALILRVLDEMRDAGVRSVTWTGGGEPTLHPDFGEIISRCPIPQGVYTNGVLITPEMAQQIKLYASWVYVSMDRPDRESYAKYKQVDAFEKAEAGIKNLVSASGDATIGVGFLLSRECWGDGWKMIELAEGLGVDYVQFRPEVEFDPAIPQHPIHDNTWIGAAMQWLDGVKDRRGVQVDLSRFEMYRNWTRHPYKVCHWAQMQTVLTPDGRLWTCCNKRGFEGESWGDLKHESFSEVAGRIKAREVNNQCRVMCRGHIPNLTLDRILSPRTGHDDFI